MHIVKVDTNSHPNSDSIILGNKFRITILFENLFRFEYQEEGKFENRASQLVFNRYFEKPNFSIQESDKELKIITKQWIIIYNKNHPFDSNSTTITSLINNKTYKLNDDVNNLYGTARTLDQTDGSIPLEDGLFSKEGFVVLDDSNSLVFENDWLKNREYQSQDLYFFGYYDDFKLGLKEYYKITGNTPLIPKYVLGNWWSKFWILNDDEMKHIVNRYKEEDIPLSVFVIDMDWHLVNIDPKWGEGWTGYTWNKELFPNPKESLKWLHSNNLKTSLNLHPADGVRGFEDAYEEYAKFMGINPKTLKPILFDAASQKSMEGYFKYALYPHEEIGVDFWWMDWQQGTTTNMKNLDPLWVLNHYHYHDLTKHGNRGLVFSRYTNKGGHRYPIGFSGDTATTWETLAFQPYFTLTASNIGFGWWSHDIGGHHLGYEDRELYMRWVQLGVFSPIFRTHSSRNLYYKREPWHWDSEILNISRKFMQLRHKLIPYIYSFAKINSEGGLPLIRPLYYHHKDKKAYNPKTQYYFGSELMIAPFVTPLLKTLNHSERKVYLPKGDWFNYFDSSYFKGGKNYTIYGTLEEMPIFAKAGSIIPLSGDQIKNGVNNSEKIIVDIFLGKSNSFELYEDDGLSIPTAYNSVITTFNLNDNNNSASLNVFVNGNQDYLPKNRSYIIRFRSVNKDILIDGDVTFNKTYDEVTRSLSIEILKPINNFTINLKDNKPLTNYFNDAEQRLTDVLFNSSFKYLDKAEIGYVYNKFFSHKTGILSLNLTTKEKIEKINNTKIPKKLKQISKNILSYNK